MEKPLAYLLGLAGFSSSKVSSLGSIKYFVRVSQFEQRSNLGGWVGQNLEIVQLEYGKKSAHPVNHYFGAKIK